MTQAPTDTAKHEPVSDEEVQRRMREVGEMALAELCRRGLSEKAIQKFLASKKQR